MTTGTSWTCASCAALQRLSPATISYKSGTFGSGLTNIGCRIPLDAIDAASSSKGFFEKTFLGWFLLGLINSIEICFLLSALFGSGLENSSERAALAINSDRPLPRALFAFVFIDFAIYPLLVNFMS